jgi:hypothetical protein
MHQQSACFREHPEQQQHVAEMFEGYDELPPLFVRAVVLKMFPSKGLLIVVC